jgi:hypothetical protein
MVILLHSLPLSYLAQVHVFKCPTGQLGVQHALVSGTKRRRMVIQSGRVHDL